MSADAAELLDRGIRAGAAAPAGGRALSLPAPVAFPRARRSPPVGNFGAAARPRIKSGAKSRQVAGAGPGFRRNWLTRPAQLDARRFCASDREPLRRLRAAIDPDPGRAAAPDQARAVGRDGRSRPSPPLLPAAICRRDFSPWVSCRTRSSRASFMPAKPMPAILPGPTPSMRPTIWSRPHPRSGRRRGALPPRLVSRRRHRRRQGPPGRRDHSRQLAQGCPAKAGGRRRALWISKSDKLIEDAKRDWTAVGGYRSDIVPLSRFRQGAAIALDEGILFTTYATLRTQAKGEKASRIQQIIDWLGRASDGVVVFDEAHAMANAAGDKGERGEKKPSQQGPGRAAPAARTAPMRASSTSRRPAPPRCRTSPMRRGSGSGAPVTFRSRRAPISCRRWKAAALPRWRCWPAI